VKIKSVCVYCGSNKGEDPLYMDSAVSLGKELLKRKISLVYGGANVGIMGCLADTVLNGGGKVIGVIPESINEWVGHKSLTELHVVDNMHSRKSLMFELSDAFIAYPGGVGTLEEIFEILSWTMLQFHAKPSGFLNIKGYYDKLFMFLRHSMDEGFIRKELFDSIILEENPASLIDRLVKYKAPEIKKWK